MCFIVLCRSSGALHLGAHAYLMGTSLSRGAPAHRAWSAQKIAKIAKHRQFCTPRAAANTKAGQGWENRAVLVSQRTARRAAIDRFSASFCGSVLRNHLEIYVRSQGRTCRQAGGTAAANG